MLCSCDAGNPSAEATADTSASRTCSGVCSPVESGGTSAARCSNQSSAAYRANKSSTAHAPPWLESSDRATHFGPPVLQRARCSGTSQGQRIRPNARDASALAPQSSHTLRACTRRTSSSSGTCISTRITRAPAARCSNRSSAAYRASRSSAAPAPPSPNRPTAPPTSGRSIRHRSVFWHSSRQRVRLMHERIGVGAAVFTDAPRRARAGPAPRPAPGSRRKSPGRAPP